MSRFPRGAESPRVACPVRPGYDPAVPFLIDGDNFAHALASAGRDADRASVCRLLGAMAAAGQRVSVVFDGRRLPAASVHEIAAEGVEVSYSGDREADAVIEERIARSSAPRRLTVVSTDWRVRKAARKRRCTSVTSEEFVRRVLTELSREQRPARREPPEKFHGPSPEDARRWQEEFGIGPGNLDNIGPEDRQ